MRRQTFNQNKEVESKTFIYGLTIKESYLDTFGHVNNAPSNKIQRPTFKFQNRATISHNKHQFHVCQTLRS